jgi:hypothetical protein
MMLMLIMTLLFMINCTLFVAVLKEVTICFDCLEGEQPNHASK